MGVLGSVCGMWNLVSLVQVLGDGFLVWRVWVVGAARFFEHPQPPLTKPLSICYNIKQVAAPSRNRRWR